MRILLERPTISLIDGLINRQAHADYVYMYPPRQAYRPFTQHQAARVPDLVESSLRRFGVLNLYVHVPFCRQICNFCNLYAVSSAGRDMNGYVDMILTEAQQHARRTDPKTVTTLYLGGGTPSLLPPTQLERLITTLLDMFARDPSRPPEETALEVDPATVNVRTLRDIRAAGVNRINLGYQSLVQNEVAQIGRRRSMDHGLRLLEEALGVGFANVCVDLIYGLEAQTDENWRSSVEQVAAVGPQTICAYSLTLRPFTGYDRRGYGDLDGATLYRRYEIADQTLRAAGYKQETHVRWVRGSGGYLQKVNHWALQNVLGLGAGARSYLWDIDFRNDYSVRSRLTPLRRYASTVAAGESPITDGYVMNDEERLRKALILNLASLSRDWFTRLLGADPLQVFDDELQALFDLSLCTVRDDTIALTAQGMKYRDLIAQALFSPNIRNKVRQFNYDE